jgi:hypothetical protein
MAQCFMKFSENSFTSWLVKMLDRTHKHDVLLLKARYFSFPFVEGK